MTFEVDKSPNPTRCRSRLVPLTREALLTTLAGGPARAGGRFDTLAIQGRHFVVQRAQGTRLGACVGLIVRAAEGQIECVSGDRASGSGHAQTDQQGLRLVATAGEVEEEKSKYATCRADRTVCPSAGVGGGGAIFGPVGSITPFDPAEAEGRGGRRTSRASQTAVVPTPTISSVDPLPSLRVLAGPSWKPFPLYLLPSSSPASDRWCGCRARWRCLLPSWPVRSRARCLPRPRPRTDACVCSDRSHVQPVSRDQPRPLPPRASPGPTSTHSALERGRDAGEGGVNVSSFPWTARFFASPVEGVYIHPQNLSDAFPWMAQVTNVAQFDAAALNYFSDPNQCKPGPHRGGGSDQTAWG